MVRDKRGGGGGGADRQSAAQIGSDRPTGTTRLPVQNVAKKISHRSEPIPLSPGGFRWNGSIKYDDKRRISAAEENRRRSDATLRAWRYLSSLRHDIGTAAVWVQTISGSDELLH